MSSWGYHAEVATDVACSARWHALGSGPASAVAVALIVLSTML